MAKIAVFGLGYVGAVSAGCLAKLGHEVMGVDVQQEKVDQIARGESPIAEAGLPELLKDAHAKGRLKATTSTAEAAHWADLSLICVGTPSREDGSLQTGYVERVCNDIGEALKDKAARHTVIVRSTLLPGTTLNLLRPIIEKASGKICGPEIGLAYNPEFLREGTAVKDFDAPPFTIVGGIDEESRNLVAELYSAVDGEIVKVAIPEAEMIKYSCNAFHALKITFANEIGNFAKSLGVNGRTVMDIVCKDKKLNLSPYYMKPGFAYGGSCLPKDLRALLSKADEVGLEMPMLESLAESNEYQKQRGIEMVMRRNPQKVSVIGFSFKAGTDDLRESPNVDLIQALLDEGLDVRLYDKNVHWAMKTFGDHSYLMSKLPHLAPLMVETLEEAIAHGEVLVVGNKSDDFLPIFAQPQEGKFVVDLVKFEAAPSWFEAMGERYEGICW